MENLKQLWEQYDEKLQASRALNERLIKKMVEEKSADRIGKIISFEYVGLALLGILLAAMLIMSGSISKGWEMKVSYALLLPQLLGWIAWSIYKLKMLHSMQFGEVQVMELVKRVQRFRLLIIREKLWGLWLTLVFLLPPAFVIAHQWVWGDSVLRHLDVYAVKAVAAIVIAVPVSLWLYRRTYLAPIQSVLHSLEELKTFNGND